MHASLPLLYAPSFPSIRRGQLEAPHVNLTYRCNQRCLHSHVNSGPTRSEAMTDESLALLHQVIDAHPVHSLDLTDGAPEMHPTSTASVPKTCSWRCVPMAHYKPTSIWPPAFPISSP